MTRVKVAAIAAVITVGVVLLLEHPGILTGGASAHFMYGSRTGEHLVVTSYALVVVYALCGALALAAACIGIRRRIKQRAAWKRRYSMKSIDGGKLPRSGDDNQGGKS